MPERTYNDFVKEYYSDLVGRTIVEVRAATFEELDNFGWDANAPVIVLDNGETIIPSQDDEGNGPGVFF